MSKRYVSGSTFNQADREVQLLRDYGITKSVDSTLGSLAALQSREVIHLINDDLLTIENTKIPINISSEEIKELEAKIGKVVTNCERSGTSVCEPMRGKILGLWKAKTSGGFTYKLAEKIMYLFNVQRLINHFEPLIEPYDAKQYNDIWKAFLALFRYGKNYTLDSLYVEPTKSEQEALVYQLSLVHASLSDDCKERTCFGANHGANVVTYSASASLSIIRALKEKFVQYGVVYDEIRENRNIFFTNYLVSSKRCDASMPEKMKFSVVADQRIEVPNYNVKQLKLTSGSNSSIIVIDVYVYVPGSIRFMKRDYATRVLEQLSPDKDTYKDLREMILLNDSHTAIIVRLPAEFSDDDVKGLTEGSVFNHAVSSDVVENFRYCTLVNAGPRVAFISSDELYGNIKAFFIRNILTSPKGSIIVESEDGKENEEYDMNDFLSVFPNFDDQFVERKILGMIDIKIGQVVDMFSDEHKSTWVNAFTHFTYSPDKSKNYEQLELIGDKVEEAAFVEYIYNTNKGITNDRMTSLVREMLSQDKQAELSDMLGIWQVGRTSYTGVKYREDILESFFGAMYIVGERVSMGLGHACVKYLTRSAYKYLQPIPDEIYQHPKSEVTHISRVILGRDNAFFTSKYTCKSEDIFEIVLGKADFDKIKGMEGVDVKGAIMASPSRNVCTDANPSDFRTTHQHIGVIVGRGVGYSEEDARLAAYTMAMKTLFDWGLNKILENIRMIKIKLSEKDFPEDIRLLKEALQKDGYTDYYIEDYSAIKLTALLGVTAKGQIETLAVSEGINVNARMRAARNYIYCKVHEK